MPRHDSVSAENRVCALPATVPRLVQHTLASRWDPPVRQGALYPRRKGNGEHYGREIVTPSTPLDLQRQGGSVRGRGRRSEAGATGSRFRLREAWMAIVVSV